MMRQISLIFLLALAGCAGGTVLNDKPADSSTAAYIEVISGDQFWIRPAQHSGKQMFQSPGIWVSDGWFILEDWCFYPKNRPSNVLTDFGMGNTHTIHFLGGHRYTLQCDPDIYAKIDLVD